VGPRDQASFSGYGNKLLLSLTAGNSLVTYKIFKQGLAPWSYI